MIEKMRIPEVIVMHQRRLVVAVVPALMVGTVFMAAAPGSATPSAGIVINEVYGGGGNTGATYTNDFIELTNRSAGRIAVDGWSVQYHSGGSGSWTSTALSGTIAPGAFYLVQESAGTGGTTPLPTPQATRGLFLSATSGTVALASTSEPLTCTDSASCAAATVDLVGYGTAAIDETAPASGASNTASVQRTAAADTDNNSVDFTAAAPTPGAANARGTAPGDVRIHDIQGSGWLSPDKGQTVTNVPGVVTAVRTSGTRGFWFQDPDPDDNPATSEGLFVYTSSPGVVPGDSVLVSGTVAEYYPLASGESVSSTANLSTTELTSPTTTVLGTAPIPAPEVITADTVPDVYAPDLGGANIESTPIDATRSALDFWESREGMSIEVDDARVVGPSDTYGEQYVTTKPAQDATYRGGTELTAENATPSGRLEVVANEGSNPEVSVGDIFTGATVGTVDYSEFGGYFLAASTLGLVASDHPAPGVASAAPAARLTIATYNVENLAPSDPQSKFAALAAGIVTNLAAPDIVAVEEVQDNSGATDDGTVAADVTLTDLTAAITADGGPVYQWREIDPVNDKDGGQPGGNIRVVFLFNPARVQFVDRGSSAVNRSTTATQVVPVHGQPALSLSPGRIDPTNPVWSSSRKPLAGQFTFRGKSVIVVANHFDAKLGDQNADGRFQYPAQSSAAQRSGQAAAVHGFVQRILKINKKADVVVFGDLNDYQFSPALTVLKTGTDDGSGPAILRDLVNTLPLDQRYTYDYDGISEVLDHILVAPAVHGVQYQVIHINSEYANQTSDHDPQVVRISP